MNFSVTEAVRLCTFWALLLITTAILRVHPAKSKRVCRRIFNWVRRLLCAWSGKTPYYRPVQTSMYRSWLYRGLIVAIPAIAAEGIIRTIYGDVDSVLLKDIWMHEGLGIKIYTVYSGVAQMLTVLYCIFYPILFGAVAFLVFLSKKLLFSLRGFRGTCTHEEKLGKLIVKGYGMVFLYISTALDLYMGYQITKKMNNFGVFGSNSDVSSLFTSFEVFQQPFPPTLEGAFLITKDAVNTVLTIAEYLTAFAVGMVAGRLFFHGMIGFAMGSFCLRYAALEDSRELAEIGLKLGGNGDDIYDEDAAGYSPLTTASEKGHMNVLTTMVSAGCQPSCHHLEVALRCSHEDVALYLIRHISCKEFADGQKRPLLELRLEDPYYPLHRAVYYGCLPVVKELLATKSYDPKSSDETGKSAFDISVERRHYECVLALVDFCQLSSEDLRRTIISSSDGHAFIQDLIMSQLHSQLSIKDVSSLGFTWDGGAKSVDRQEACDALLHAVTDRLVAEIGSEFYGGNKVEIQSFPIVLLAALLLSAGADPCSPDLNNKGRTCLHKVARVGWSWACGFILGAKVNVFEEIRNS